MAVKSWDDTFATKTGIDVTKDECDSQAFFGRAFGCPNPEGKVSVNFEGTGFYIPETVRLLRCVLNTNTFYHEYETISYLFYYILFLNKSQLCIRRSVEVQ